MLDATRYLNAARQELEGSPGLLDEAVVFETFEGVTSGDAPLTGLSVILDDDERICAIHLYPSGRDGHRQYRGPLPGGITFDRAPGEVRAALGPPDRWSAAQVLPILGELGPWDLFRLPDMWVNVQYAVDERSVALITLMRELPEERHQDRLVPVFVPRLVVVLTIEERKRGRPLTEREVEELRDGATCIMVDESAVAERYLDEGYWDIDPEHAWEQWLALRDQPGQA